MFANKGQLKVTILIVGFLVVGLGMYGAFYALDVYGHGAAISRNNSDDARVNETISDVSYPSTCPACNNPRNYIARTTTYDLWRRTDHYHLSWSGWVYQYTTGYYVRTVTEYTSFWDECPTPNCGG